MNFDDTFGNASELVHSALISNWVAPAPWIYLSYLSRGHVKKAQGRLEEALPDFVEAARLHNSCFEALFYKAQLLCKLQRHDEAVEASVKAYEAVEDGVKAYETFISNILPEGSGRQNFNAASTLLSECSDKLLEARKNNHMEIADKHNGRIREALKLRYDCDEAEISARTDISNETKLELIMVKKNEWSKTEKFVDKAFDLAVDSQATVPDYMTDQVTHYIMHHPVCTESGFSMEETTVLKTMMEPASGGRNPFTGAKLSGDDLRRNNALRDAYTELMDKKNAWEGEF